MSNVHLMDTLNCDIKDKINSSVAPWVFQLLLNEDDDNYLCIASLPQ